MTAIDGRVSEVRLWARLWPLLLASAVGLVPFTVFSTFLVPIADAAGSDVASVGALRGLGGVAALVVGLATAPLVGRVDRDRLSGWGLCGLAAASLAALHGGFASLVVFCAGVGASTAVLMPALLSAAAERFEDDAAGGRAATVVTAAQSLAAVGAGPVIGVIAWSTGWRGPLVATAAVSAALAAGFIRRGRTTRPPDADRPAYVETFRRLAGRPDLLALVTIAGLRTASLMGCLAYMAAWYDHRFGLSAPVFTLVWTVSGLSFFVGNHVAGRRLGAATTRRAELSILVGIVASAIGLVVLFWAPHIAVSVAGTAMQAAGHATVAAAVTTLIVRRAGPTRTAVLSVNAAAMSLGVFVGAAIGGVGLAIAGYAGVAVALGAPLALATVVGLAVVRRRRPDRGSS